MNRLCISIRSLKRHHYLRSCLDSLSNNVDLKGVDFYFFQDGAVNPFSGKRYATDKEIKSSLKVFEDSKLLNKTIYQSRDNLGPAIRNQYQLETLFPKYEHVVLADNDLVFNKYYIKTLKVLFNQFGKDKDAGTIQTSFRHGNGYQKEEEARRLQDLVSYGFSHFCEMGFWRKSWKKIKPYMEPYFRLTEKCDFNKFLLERNSYKDIKEKLYKRYGAFMDGEVTTEDYTLAKSAEMAGYRGIHTLALRYKLIGEKGMFSFDGDRWEKDGFGGVTLFDVGNVEKYILLEK